MTVSVLELWKRHNGHRGRSATSRAAAPALQPARTGYPLLDAASRWGPTTGLSHDRQCRASRSRRAAPAVGGDCRLRYPRPVLLEGGWAVAELAGRTVRAAAVCQCGAPHVSTGQSLGHRNSPSEFSDPERITPQARRRRQLLCLTIRANNHDFDMPSLEGVTLTRTVAVRRLQ